MSVINWLSGKKTYFLAGAAIIYAASQYWGGTIDLNGFLTAVGVATGAITLRAGIAKSGV